MSQEVKNLIARLHDRKSGLVFAYEESALFIHGVETAFFESAEWIAFERMALTENPLLKYDDEWFQRFRTLKFFNKQLADEWREQVGFVDFWSERVSPIWMYFGERGFHPVVWFSRKDRIATGTEIHFQNMKPKP